MKFPTFEAHLEAKYGVRNYMRQISQFYDEIDSNLSRIIFRMRPDEDLLRKAIPILKMYSEAHIYDLQVRRTKRGRNKAIYIRSLEPRLGTTVVGKFAGDEVEIGSEYQEQIIALVQRELLLGSNADETICAVQPVAFTYHAMLRLWERGSGNGQTFHLFMADIFKRLRGVAALVELSHLAVRGTLPNYIAVPFLDGFVIASKRDTNINSTAMRWGIKRSKKGVRILQFKEENHFIWESYFSIGEVDITTFEGWFAVTYMGANDLSGWERSQAAHAFDRLMQDLDLDEVARMREWLTRPAPEGDLGKYCSNLPDPKRVLALQEEMIPRSDPPDERFHFIRF
ncbi:hypothetical protein KUV75_04080 [Qipengyuania gaetbuli]|uniref:hypothetical protein n=1 Tax=Qipengyuania gaetbuli TaxID=266952 RepID=UPI001C99727F|nr:hypothetical protein [Qipengyuania gaetbuli]MBY6014079.1 hypothetical protein [Qipengyuania gaetbuli]